MKRLVAINKLHQGQLKLLTILARSYNVSIEEIINNLVKEYIEVHAPIFLEELKNKTTAMLPHPGVTLGRLKLGVGSKYTISVSDLCDVLDVDNNKDFLTKLLSSSGKLSKDEQIKTIEDAINEILASPN